MKKVLLIVLAVFSTTALAQKKVVCYYGTWAAYRTGSAQFTVDNIDPTICTHIIYTFFGVNSDGTWKSLDPYLDLTENYGRGFVSKFMGLKSRNPNVKLMASIGGWSAGTATFQQVAAAPSLRTSFANSVLSLLQTYGFDGFDLDWEYPLISDQNNFVSLLAELSNKLRPNGKLLTIAVGATRNQATESYKIPSIVPLIDFINLMTYDLHGSWDPRTGLNSPLYAGPNDPTELNVDACVNHWLNQGCPKEKLIVGIPLYGRSFTLSSPNGNGVGAPANGAGAQGAFIPESGFLPYFEICLNVKSNGWLRVFESSQLTPYAFKGNQWVGYDDTQSLNVKLNYILSKDLGGAMFWSIETDDFNNLCGEGRYPLVSLAYNRLNAVVTTAPVTTRSSTVATTRPAAVTTARPVTTVKPTVPTTALTTTPPASLACPQPSGIFRHPLSCTAFIICDNGFMYMFACPNGLNFNAITRNCDWPENAPCIIASRTTVPPITTTTKAPQGNGCANRIGIFANPADCTTFYNCGPNGVGALMYCGPGLAFNAIYSVCDWKSNVPSCA